MYSTPPPSPRGEATPPVTPDRTVLAVSPIANGVGSPLKRQRTELRPPPTPARGKQVVPKGITGVFQGVPFGTPPRGPPIGSGAFASAYQCQSPSGPVVSKDTCIGIGKHCVCPKDAGKEASYYGEDGCAPGICYQHDGAIHGLMPLAKPLNELPNPELQRLWAQIKDSIEKAPIGVVRDCKPDNMGLVPSGSAFPVLKNGALEWRKTTAEMVVFIDLNHIEGDGDGNWALLIDDPSDQMMRDFKVALMAEWIQNPAEECLQRRRRVEDQFRQKN